MKIKSTNILILIFLFNILIFPQEKKILKLETVEKKLLFGLTEKVPAFKPKIGLVLSGGGARGFAQIGAIKALEEAGIEIDQIIGTSMGSIVGGLYSSGYLIDEVDSIVKNTDWDQILALDRETNRRELFVDQKITEDKAIFALRLSGLTPVIPTSINTGHKLSNFLNLLTFQAPVHVNNKFDELQISFRAVCTDLVTGNSVILDGGSLSQAMRASSSVTFLLSPVTIDSLILVDGGLVSNIPVDIAKDLGNDYIIAVNTTSDLRTKEELQFPWIVADQVVSIPMKILNEQQLQKADVVIQPEINNKLSTDFSNSEFLINEGYKAAKQVIEKIKADIDSIIKKRMGVPEYYIKKIIVEYENVSEGRYLFDRYSRKDSVSNFEIISDLYELFETGIYKDVYAEIDEQEDFTRLRVIADENPKINNITVFGSLPMNIEEVLKICEPIKNKNFSGRKLEQKIIKVLRNFRAAGLSLAKLKLLEFDEKSGELNIYFDAGYIDSLQIIGNEITNETVITREFPLKQGDLFNYDLVRQGLINLRSTNLFDNIFLNVHREENKIILIIDVKEKPSMLARFGFKIDNENKAQFNIDLRDENLFGSGTELGLLLNASSRTRGAAIEHKSNRVFDTYFTYKIEGFIESKDIFTYEDDFQNNPRYFSRSVNGEYRNSNYGLSVALGSQVRRFGNLIFKGKYLFNKITEIEVGEIEPEDNQIVSLEISSTIDTQDKYPFPQRGFYFNGIYESAQTILGGDVGFTKISFQYKSYFTINDIHTFSPSIKMGFGDNTLPLSQHFLLGGQNSFFGMAENEFYGRQIFSSSFEYRLKLPFQLFFDTYTKIRYDLGTTWLLPEQIRFKDLRHGIGASLSFDTPIGPADFSIGRSFLFLKNLPGNPLSFGPVSFYFSIGYYY